MSDVQHHPVRREATDAEARALASAVRLRILRACLHESLTNREIAQRIDRNPGSVLHHVRTLVDTGFLIPDEARRGVRGAREIPYRATRKSWFLDGAVASKEGEPHLGGRNHMLAAFLADVAVAGEGSLESSRLGLMLSAGELAELRDRLHGLLDEYARRPVTPGGQRWSVFLGMHPEDG